MHSRMVNKTRYDDSGKPIKQISFTVKSLGGNLSEKQFTIVKRNFRSSTKLLSLDSTILIDELTAETRAVHGSVQVGFVPNPEPTCENRVNGLTTRHRPSTTSGRVGSIFGRQRLGWLASVWVWIIGSSSKSPHQAQIWAKITRSKQKSKKNHNIKLRFERRSPDLSKNPHIKFRFEWKFLLMPDLRKIEAKARVNPSKIFISPSNLSKKT